MGLNVVFMGTPDFAVPALRALINSEHNVICVYSQPPRPKGRGHKIQKSPVHELAEINNIEVRTPKSFKQNEQAIEDFTNLKADIAVVAAYGLILPESILNAPKYGCLNIHASLLPRWRGAAPIQKAIWAGDSETGITIMQMDKGLDTGDMIMKEKTPIYTDTTAPSLHDKLSLMGASMIVKALDECELNGGLSGEKQDDNLSTYASMLSKNDGKIDWNKSAEEIHRQVRALNPWPGCFSISEDGKRIKIIETLLTDKKSEEIAGKIVDKKGGVVCGDGRILRIIAIQPENSKKMDINSAINGGYLSIGRCL